MRIKRIALGASQDCESWRAKALAKHRIKKTDYGYPMPSFVPEEFETEFLDWKVLPPIGYNAKVSDLYDMYSLEKEYASSPCAKKEEKEVIAKAEAQKAEKKVKYSSTLFIGLGLAAAGILITLTGKK